MGVDQVIERASDTMAVRRVFGEPIERDGVTVIPAALVTGGGGGGGATPQGEGGGFGMTAKPLGVYEVTGGKVRWRPAINVNRVILGGQIVLALGLLTLGAVLRASHAGQGNLWQRLHG
ncbi:MAG: hypothetical protein QM765_32120 [Myxococcales bacterium]